jgi:hypothetical protein
MLLILHLYNLLTYLYTIITSTLQRPFKVSLGGVDFGVKREK